MKKLSGFTLIELLIVVAIIAILAAIAVPNFLEAQTRAKVSRVKSDLRTMGTALETYRIDHNKLPCDYDVNPDPVIPGKTGGTYASGILHPGVVLPNGTLRIGLTTPVSYITNCWVEDPFIGRNGGNIDIDQQLYSYNLMVVGWGDKQPNANYTNPAFSNYYGEYRLGSIGPDRDFYNGAGFSTRRHVVPYDPSNGTVSKGNIWRSGKETECTGTPVGFPTS